jgi:hypothetical protein
MLIPTLFPAASLTTDLYTQTPLLCRDECTSGPNIRLDGDDRRIFGAINSEDKVAEVLRDELPE